MCVRIVRSATVVRPPWDADSLTVYIPETLSRNQANHILRMVLGGMGVPQPPTGARCWCGEQADIDRTCRATASEVINVGA